MAEDVVWRILIDGSDTLSSIRACVVLPFFRDCPPFRDFVTPYSTWRGVLEYNAVSKIALVNRPDAVFDLERPRRGLGRYPSDSVGQLRWLIEEQALPFLLQFTTLGEVLAAVKVGKIQPYGGRGPWYYGEAVRSLIEWRMGDREAARASLEKAAANARSIEKGVGGEFSEFVQTVATYIELREPFGHVEVPPAWPVIDQEARAWCDGVWRPLGDRHPQCQASLVIQAHDGDTAGVLYQPMGAGTGLAWVGLGPVEDDDYAVEREVEGLLQWAVIATGRSADRSRLRRILEPIEAGDLLSRLTDLCEVLGVVVPSA